MLDHCLVIYLLALNLFNIPASIHRWFYGFLCLFAWNNFLLTSEICARHFNIQELSCGCYLHHLVFFFALSYVSFLVLIVYLVFQLFGKGILCANWRLDSKSLFSLISLTINLNPSTHYTHIPAGAAICTPCATGHKAQEEGQCYATLICLAFTPFLYTWACIYHTTQWSDQSVVRSIIWTAMCCGCLDWFLLGNFPAFEIFDVIRDDRNLSCMGG